MSSRLIAIGDIHGCLAALDKLLGIIAPTSEDQIVALGDYVDRGPNSKGVVDRLIELQATCDVIALQGNHEEMMLDVVQDRKPHERWLQYGGVATLDSYGFRGDLNIFSEAHQQFYASMVDYFETDKYFFVHANYDPEKSLDQQSIYNLRWQKLTEVVPPPHPNGKRAIVGHTHDPDGEIFDVGHLVCIDTHCYGGGWLTALDVEAGTIWQADMQGRTRTIEAAHPG